MSLTDHRRCMSSTLLWVLAWVWCMSSTVFGVSIHLCLTYIFNCLMRFALRLIIALQLWLDILFTISPLNHHLNIILLSTFLCLQPIYFSLIETKTQKNTTNFSPQGRESWCINTSGCHMTIQDIAIELNPGKVSFMRGVTWGWYSVPSWRGRC